MGFTGSGFGGYHSFGRDQPAVDPQLVGRAGGGEFERQRLFGGAGEDDRLAAAAGKVAGSKEPAVIKFPFAI